jgi:hypothetical protein
MCGPPDDRFGASGPVVETDWHAVGGGVQAAQTAVFRTCGVLGHAAGDQEGQWYGVRYHRWRLKRAYLMKMGVFDASLHDAAGGHRWLSRSRATQRTTHDEEADLPRWSRGKSPVPQAS